MHRIEHTKLREVVGISICFDPEDDQSCGEDAALMEQYKAFTTALDGCFKDEPEAAEEEHSKWVIRMEMSAKTCLIVVLQWTTSTSQSRMRTAMMCLVVQRLQQRQPGLQDPSQ